MADEVQEKFSLQLTDKLTEVSEALPKDFNKTRFVQNCVALMNEHPELARLNKREVIQGLLKGAYLGLDYMNKECYLIPYKNTIQFQTDYKGECKFVKKYSVRPILDIQSKVVKEGDIFNPTVIDGRPSFEFKPVPFNTKEEVGVFAYVVYKDGGMEYELMDREEVEKVRNVYSRASNSKAWQNSWSEMARKTVLRRLLKHISVDFESTEALKAWEEGGDLDTNVVNRPTTGEVNNPFEQMPEVQAEATVVEPEEEPEVDLPDFLQGGE